MARRPLKPLVRGGGYYPSARWTPLVYPGGYTTANGGGQPEPEAVLKTVTGSLIHITDALALPAEALTVNVEPIQDLHGYENPWPAGGGKNKLPYPYYTKDGTLSGVTFSTAQDGKITASGTTTEGVNFFLARDISLAAGTYTLSIDGTHTALSLLARNPDANIMLASIAPSQTTATFTLEETANVRLYFNTSTVGVSVSISAYVQLEAGSTATAYAPYSNICPISGRTSATVTRTGKNLVDANTVWAAFLQPDGTFYHPLGNVHFYIPQELVGKQLTFSAYAKADANNARLRVCAVIGGASQNGNFINNTSEFSLTQLTFTPTSTSDYIVLQNSGVNGTYKNIQLELGSTATDYEPYQGNTYTIQLGDTVYGGTLDVTAGKMVVDRAMKVFSGSWSEGWLKSDYGYFGTGKISGAIDRNAERSDFQSNLYAYGAINNNSSTLGGCLIWRSVRVRLADMSISLDDWKAQLASTPMQVVYTLAQPIEITLTPTQIDMLLGTNNLWADAGDSTLTYYAEGEASTSEALGILLGGTYNNPGGADDASDDEALGILLGGS